MATTFVCKCCGKRVKKDTHKKTGQRYCCLKSCQQARKNSWERDKISSDVIYCEKRKASKKRWREKPRGYLYQIYHLKSVPLLVTSGLAQAQGVDCGNSVFYDLKNNPKVNWRSLLYLVVLRFRNLAGKLNPNLTGNVRAFIFDDSPLPKTSHKTELASRVHDHVSGSFILGYKILVMGYWDGLSFYPLDFSIHREKGGQIDSVKQILETANKRLKSQRQVLKETVQRFSEAQQIF